MPNHLCLLIGVFLLGFASSQYNNPPPSLYNDTKINDIAARSFSDDDFEVDFVYLKSGVELEKASIVPSASGVRRLWGVPDTEALVGRLFSYPIPADAFEGNVLQYQFSNLPSWMSYSSNRGVIEGVASKADVGPHYITIWAKGPDGAQAKDIFAIQVNPTSESLLVKEAKCLPKQDLTVLTIVIETSFSSLLPREKINMINKISAMFMVKANKISLLPTTTDFDPLADDDAIMAGPGTSQMGASSKPSRTGPQAYMLVQWSVGCGGEISKNDQAVIEYVGKASKNGKLQMAIDAPVLGWHVTQVNPINKRVRRETDYSGDSTDYTENDYEYDYDDYFKLNNDRVVPSLATPVFPESPSTTVTGEPANRNYVSPVLQVVPISTPLYIPIKPTRVVEASPTVHKTDYNAHLGGEDYDYGDGGFDPIHHHGDPVLDSSLLTHPTTSADYTTPLTRTSTIRSDPSRNPNHIEVTSVPDASETTEYAVKNFPPRINVRIQKLAWIAGNVYKMQIPENSFMDVEDGSTRNLSLVLKDESGQVFNRDSWIQFDPSKQEVYALPLERHIGKYDFRLEAMDKDRKSVIEYLKISVRQHNQARNFHHQFTAVLRMEKKYEYDFAYSLDWQVKAVEKIAELFNDSVASINVRNISTNPVQISWTNVSLVDSLSTVCPTDELEAIGDVMLSGHGPEPSAKAERIFLPEFTLKKIHTQFYDPCETHHHPDRIPMPETPIIRGTETESIHKENSGPIFRNQIDKLSAKVGQLFRKQVPDATCYDMENGNSRNLKMQLLTADLSAPPSSSWLQFDSANQEFFGLPLADDVGKKEYILECMDGGGETETDALIVEVLKPMSTSLTPVIFSLTFNLTYETLMKSALQKTKLIQRIAQSFGDSSPNNVVVDSLHKGSVVVDWHNGSLPSDPCPKEDIRRLREIMTDDNGQLLQEFKDIFLPDFVLTDGRIVPSGSCLAGDTPTHPEEPDVGNLDEEGLSPSDEDTLLTFIVPAVIIAVMLLLAAVIACCLYRRRRYGKMSMTDDHTFVSKGIPIIFAEELDDHRPDNAKSPVIMKEEKPPLPPPEYQRNSPPRNERPRPQSGDINTSDDAPYHPPPPFTASNGASRNQRPNLPPAYRKPPTYVPP